MQFYDPFVVTGTITDKGDYIEFYYPDKTVERWSEDAHHVACVGFRRAHLPHLLAFHPANEGAVPVQYRRKLVDKGMLKGVADEIILTPPKGFINCAIEIKRSTKAKSSPVSEEQKKFLRMNRELGGFSCVAYGYASYIKVLKHLIYLPNDFTI